MITSAMISELRREYGDVPKKTRVTRDGDNSSTLFNLGEFPIIEGSESVSISGGAALADTSAKYTLDDDSGDLTMVVAAPASGDELKVDFKYAHWNNTNWNEAINQGINMLKARGFYRQTVRQTLTVSGGTRVSDGPSACVDIYEYLYQPTSGKFAKLPVNWSYQQDANKVIFGSPFTTSISAARSYLRNPQTYAAISATVDLPGEWIEPVKKYAGAMFHRSVAAKNAKAGNASIDEGHFSFSNLRAMANDLLTEFDSFATRAKPSRPAKDIQYHIPGGGIA